MSEAASYAFTAKLDVPYEEAMELVTAALKEEGFGVLTEIDVKTTMKQKIDADFRKYVDPRRVQSAFGAPGVDD